MGAIGATVLLDTHVLLWWWSDPARLTDTVLALLKDSRNRVLVSAASAWEVATKYRIGKLPAGGRIVAEWEERIATDGFLQLAVSHAHALKAGSLEGAHRDPFDRMLAAQSLIEDVPVVSSDAALSTLGAARVWD